MIEFHIKPLAAGRVGEDNAPVTLTRASRRYLIAPTYTRSCGRKELAPMKEPDSLGKRRVDRRTFLAASAGAAAAAGVTGKLAAAETNTQPTPTGHPHEQGAAASTTPQRDSGGSGGVVLETVTARPNATAPYSCNSL
jgi:hypothetical protein